ncbi:hypothetical protein ACHAWT_010873 [Skeletonema menzelii]
MSGSVLTHRSNRASGLFADGNNSVVVKSVPVKGPQDGLKSRRIINEDDDTATVKSNPNGSPTQYTQSSSNRYVLPCFRIRRSKQSALVCLAMCAIVLSIISSFLAYQSLSSLPSGNFLPSPKQWGAGRESRIQARKQRRASLSTAASEEESGMKEDDDSVQYSDYEAHLLNFIFNIRAEGVKFDLLSLREPDPPGQEMGFYTQLGCDVFNRLSNGNNTTTTVPHKERIRKLWKSHVPSILEASRHPGDPDYSHRNFTETILKSLSPYSLLDPSVASSNPRRMMKSDDIERILGILVRRLFGLFQKHDKNVSSNTTIHVPPPLRIAVFGGPTTEGTGCRRAKIGISTKSIMSNPVFCGFPYRLENFLNSFLLPHKVLKQLRLTLGPANVDGGEFRLVEVINLAEEGTDSEYSAARVRNRIYPPLTKAQNGATGYGGGPPDVVIDAYGIDEYGKDISEIRSTYDTLWQPSHANGKGCFKENQKPYPVIVRAVLEDRPSTSDGSPVTSSIMTAILGDAVDDVEEGEMSFPDYRDPDDKEIEAGGVFGMAGHIASSWAIAFNLASSALWHCASKRHSHPHPKAKRRMYNHANCDNGIDSPCIFSFLAGPKGTTARPSAIASTLLPFIVENTGWQPGTDMDAGFARKGGLIGSGAGASMTLLFRNVTRPVRRLDVVSLRSTSHVWREGKAKFVLVTGGDFSHGKEAAEASSKSAREVTFEISADLNAGVSNNGEDQHVSYHFGLDLDYAEANESVGKDLLLRITLTEGAKFKILGLMLCE